MSVELHVLTPTAILPRALAPRDGFERVWKHTSFEDGRTAPSWRGFWRLADAPDGAGHEPAFILKAQRTPRGSGVLQRADRAFRTQREIEGLTAFAASGAPVPELVAWGIERHRGRPRRSFLLQRLVPDAVDFDTLLRRETRPEVRRRAIQAVGAEVTALHALGHFHRNLAARNLLVREQDRGFACFFIDCPRASCDAPRWRRAYLARADRLMLALYAAKAGADEEEQRALLVASGEREIPRALDLLRTRIRHRRVRAPHKLAWLWFGA